MEKVIRKTVGILFDRIELEQEIHTRTAQKRMEFIILAAMSPAMLLLLRVSSGSYLAIMYETLAGRLLMTIAFLLTALAIFIGFHIMRIRL
jgi:tight adherence protein B